MHTAHIDAQSTPRRIQTCADHSRSVADLAKALLAPCGLSTTGYQWGRMLAVMEKIERDTYDLDEKREPNAIRMQSVFVKRPGYAFMAIMEQLKNAYYPRLHVGLRTKYEKLISEIMEEIHLSLKEPEEYGKPLTESYLPGYYLQKSALYTKKETEETEENTDEV